MTATGNLALDALVEMFDTEVASITDNPDSTQETRVLASHASWVVGALIAEITKKNEFITFMLK